MPSLDEAPDYLIRDRDASYGQAVAKRLTAMGKHIVALALGAEEESMDLFGSAT
jgi:hypothetical protein